MKYGVFVPQGWRLDLAGITGDAEKWAACERVTRELEEQGWEQLLVFDHFHTFPSKQVEATFECWSMMAHMAATTSRARIGQMVTCNEYRTPAYLAKIAATVDVMSGGRLDLGLGCGWYGEEFDAYGYDYGTIGRRLRRLEESLILLKRLWQEDRVDYEGKHYKAVDTICEPKPLQSPHPPIWIGGRGEKILLRLVAEHANVWNYNGPQREFPHYLEVLKRHCSDVGRDFDTIRITCMSGGVAFDSDAELAVYEERIRPQGRELERTLAGIDCSGSRQKCIDFLAEWKRLGAEQVCFMFNDIASHGQGDSQAEIFQREILPKI